MARKRILISDFTGGVSEITDPGTLPEKIHQILNNRKLQQTDRIETLNHSTAWDVGSFIARLESEELEDSLRALFFWKPNFKITDGEGSQLLDYVILVYTDDNPPLPDAHNGEMNPLSTHNRSTSTGTLHLFYDNAGSWTSTPLFTDYSFPDITRNSWGLTICDGRENNNLRYVEITSKGKISYGDVGLPAPILRPVYQHTSEVDDVVETDYPSPGMTIPAGVVPQHAYTQEDFAGVESNPSPLSNTIMGTIWDAGRLQQLWLGSVDDDGVYTYDTTFDKYQRRVQLYQLQTYGGLSFPDQVLRRLEYLNIYRRWIAFSEGVDPWTDMKRVHQLRIPSEIETETTLSFVNDVYPVVLANPTLSWENDNEIKGDYLTSDRDIVFLANATNQRDFPFSFDNTCEIQVVNNNTRNYAINFHLEVKIATADIEGFTSTEWNDIASHPNLYRIFDIDKTTPCHVLYSIETGYIYLVIFIPHGLLANQRHILYLCWGGTGVTEGSWMGTGGGSFLEFDVTNRTMTALPSGQAVFTKSRARSLSHLICMTNEETIQMNSTFLYNKANNHLNIKAITGNLDYPSETVYGFTGVQKITDSTYYLCGNPLLLAYDGWQHYTDTYRTRANNWDLGAGTTDLDKITGYKEFSIVGTLKSAYVSVNDYYHDLLLLKTEDYTYCFGIKFQTGGGGFGVPVLYMGRDWTNYEEKTLSGSMETVLCDPAGFHLTYVLTIQISDSEISIKCLLVGYTETPSLAYELVTFTPTHGWIMAEVPDKGLNVCLCRPVDEVTEAVGNTYYGGFDFYRDLYLNTAAKMSYFACRKPYFYEDVVGYSMEDEVNHNIFFKINDTQKAKGIMRWSDASGRVYPDLNQFPVNSYIKAHLIIPAMYSDATKTALLILTEYGNRQFIASGDPSTWYQNAFLTDNLVENSNEFLIVNRESLCRIGDAIIYRSYAGLIVCDRNFQNRQYLFKNRLNEEADFTKTCIVNFLSPFNFLLVCFHDYADPSLSKMYLLDATLNFCPVQYKPKDRTDFSNLFPVSVHNLNESVLFLNHKLSDDETPIHSLLPFTFFDSEYKELVQDIQTRRIYIGNSIVRRIRIKYVNPQVTPYVYISIGEVPYLEFEEIEFETSDPQSFTLTCNGIHYPITVTAPDNYAMRGHGQPGEYVSSFEITPYPDGRKFSVVIDVIYTAPEYTDGEPVLSDIVTECLEAPAAACHLSGTALDSPGVEMPGQEELLYDLRNKSGVTLNGDGVHVDKWVSVNPVFDFKSYANDQRPHITTDPSDLFGGLPTVYSIKETGIDYKSIMNKDFILQGEGGKNGVTFALVFKHDGYKNQTNECLYSPTQYLWATNSGTYLLMDYPFNENVTTGSDAVWNYQKTYLWLVPKTGYEKEYDGLSIPLMPDFSDGFHALVIKIDFSGSSKKWELWADGVLVYTASPTNWQGLTNIPGMIVNMNRTSTGCKYAMLTGWDRALTTAEIEQYFEFVNQEKV